MNTPNEVTASGSAPRMDYSLGSGPLPEIMPCGFNRAKETLRKRNQHYAACSHPACKQRAAVLQELVKQHRNARARESRQAIKAAYESCGMRRVKGALGGTYWE